MNDLYFRPNNSTRQWWTLPLKVAHIAAMEKLLAKVSEDERRDAINRAIDTAKKELDEMKQTQSAIRRRHPKEPLIRVDQRPNAV